VTLSGIKTYAVKTRATYSCSALNSIGANWYLNGTISTQLHLTNVTELFFNNTNVGIFVFKYLTGAYNNTHVSCEAIFPGGEIVPSAHNMTLIMQGMRVEGC